jgi:hypothetical protein
MKARTYSRAEITRPFPPGQDMNVEARPQRWPKGALFVTQADFNTLHLLFTLVLACACEAAETVDERPGNGVSVFSLFGYHRADGGVVMHRWSYPGQVDAIEVEYADRAFAEWYQNDLPKRTALERLRAKRQLLVERSADAAKILARQRGGAR